MKKSQAIKVAIRVRPKNERQIKIGSPECVQTGGAVITLKKQGEQKEFCFDYVFDSNGRQEEVYETTAFNLVESVAEGYNGTIFAYGQTGAGKTWTMVGAPQDEHLKGIIPRTFAHLFNITQSGEAQQYLLRASFIEIYNEEIRDLLVDKRTDSKRELKESPDKGVFIKDLTMAPVKSVPDMQKLLAFGNINKTVHGTEMNATSSRSHTVFTIFFDTLSEVGGKQSVRAGKLNLVDLAGSERQNKTKAEGDRLKEGAKINLSLSALGNVINVLAQGKKGVHIPYRDSKLTRILQDSLGGNTKTVMIASVSPALDNYDQTLGTLRYASRAKTIKNAPKVNEDPKDALIKQYAEEIRKLKAELAGQAPITELEPTDDRIKEIEERLRKEISGEKEQLQAERNKLLREKDAEKEELVRRLKEMEENLLKKNEMTQSQTIEQRKKKKRKILKQEELIAEQIQEYTAANQNLLEGKLPTFGSPQEEVVFLRDLTSKLRVKCKGYITEAKDLDKEFEAERESFTETLRELESQLSFFKGIAKVLLTDNEILKIRDNSGYDAEKREYFVAPFFLKESGVHFPKALTKQQLDDLLNEKKSSRNLEFVAAGPFKSKEEEQSKTGPNFRSRKYVYKIPDLEQYQGKDYQKLADSLCESQEIGPFNRTSLMFRDTDRKRGDSARSSLSRGKKLEPLKLTNKKSEEDPESISPKRPASRSKCTFEPLGNR